MIELKIEAELPDPAKISSFLALQVIVRGYDTASVFHAFQAEALKNISSAVPGIDGMVSFTVDKMSMDETAWSLNVQGAALGEMYANFDAFQGAVQDAMNKVFHG